jgi:signal transduction histidine kinase
MSIDSQRRQATLSWLFVGVLFVLCGVLGVLQYRWIGEVSVAARDRLRASLQASLERVSRDFQSELTTAFRALVPESAGNDPAALVREASERYAAWKASDHQAQLFRSVAIAVREGDALVLHRPDAEGRWQASPWPSDWSALREFMQAMISREGPGFRGVGPTAYPANLFELPIFAAGGPAFGGPRRNAAWMIFDVNLKYVAEVILPELLQRHLGTAGALEYQYELVPRGNPSVALFSSDPDPEARIAANADASVPFADAAPDFFRVRGRGGRGPILSLDGPRGPVAGRWELSVRHRSGSLEAVVAKTRLRNLAVTGGLLLLIIASAAALLRFTRRSQRLAELQMNFVAGVSHELRTPLTVINTAAYNLQSKPNRDPEQVAKYGALIRQESGRLKELVEQVLSFAGSNAARMTQETQPLAVADLLDASIESSRAVLEGGHFAVEKDIAPGLPLIAGDSRALQHAVQNLLGNAVKYGAGAMNWIGLSAREATVDGQQVIEIRVADRGPGIPADEQRHIFDPFYRGKRAQQDQIHGTGLGLTLVKEIVTAHRGSIVVRSQPEKGTEFVVRIPVAPQAYQDEFANTAGRG